MITRERVIHNSSISSVIARKTFDKIHARVYNKGVERPHGDAGKQNPWDR